MRKLPGIILLLVCISTLQTSIAAIDSCSWNNDRKSDYFMQQEDIRELLDRFSIQIASDSRSEECQSTYNYLINYLDLNKNLLPDLYGSVNRYLGAYHLYNRNYEDAKHFYIEALMAFEKVEDIDTTDLTRVLSGLGYVYYQLEEYDESIDYYQSSVELRKSRYGEKSADLITPYLNLAASYLGNKEYDDASAIAQKGIDIVAFTNSGLNQLGRLYYNLGSAYSGRGDFKSAINFYHVAESMQEQYNPGDAEMMISIYNGYGVVFNVENDIPNSIINYKKMIALLESMSEPYQDAISNYTNYAYLLGKSGQTDAAERVYQKAIDYCEKYYGRNDNLYFTAKEEMAFFQYYFREDFETAYNLYVSLLEDAEYLDLNLDLVNDIKRGLAKVLGNRNELDQALDLYNEILISGEKLDFDDKVFVYKGRSEIYQKRYLVEGIDDAITKALDDVDLSVTYLDSLRLDQTAEDSKLQITGRFDYIWDDAIWLASEMYKNTSQSIYLNRAFHYSEKSKAATLLSSTREIQAMRSHIPEELIKREQDLNQDIESLSNDIYTENSRENPDSELVRSYEEDRSRFILSRDSLISLFETEYPAYYNLKHEADVAECYDVRSYIGRTSNFIEYFLSDTLLYTFVFNRKGCELVRIAIDSSTSNLINEFRYDIVNPSIEQGAKAQFKRLLSNGYLLNNILIEPIRPYLVSKKLIIAADDILSYIPFEALISDTTSVNSTSYRDVDFLFKDYEIIYTYSASLMIETEGRGRSLVNNALVFAPEYSGLDDTDSILLSRQMERGPLSNIPGAKEEAIYISNLLGGQLFLDNEATEYRFTCESSSEKVIHLAMHTLLNDRKPMLSKMVFSLESDTIEDGLLNTYEIYDLKLDAKMVVLSSCNTGTGYLQAGEGVISLARGFMFAGTPTVVMSLWEVDDYSASEIIKLFYKNLKNGYSKSEALKMARRKYLKSSDQLRSHPYFWCTLVIMGDDEPIFHKRLTIGLIALVLLSIIAISRRSYMPKFS